MNQRLTRRTRKARIFDDVLLQSYYCRGLQWPRLMVNLRKGQAMCEHRIEPKPCCKKAFQVTRADRWPGLNRDLGSAWTEMTAAFVVDFILIAADSHLRPTVWQPERDSRTQYSGQAVGFKREEPHAALSFRAAYISSDVHLRKVGYPWQCRKPRRAQCSYCKRS